MRIFALSFQTIALIAGLAATDLSAASFPLKSPEEYLRKEDLFESFKKLPATRDDSKLLNSKISQTITTARRTGDTWFVGNVNDDNAARSVEAKLFMDAEDTDGVINPKPDKIEKTVEQGDVIAAKMALDGGHSMILRPMKSFFWND